MVSSSSEWGVKILSFDFFDIILMVRNSKLPKVHACRSFYSLFNSLSFSFARLIVHGTPNISLQHQGLCWRGHFEILWVHSLSSAYANPKWENFSEPISERFRLWDCEIFSFVLSCSSLSPGCIFCHCSKKPSPLGGNVYPAVFFSIDNSICLRTGWALASVLTPSMCSESSASRSRPCWCKSMDGLKVEIKVWGRIEVVGVKSGNQILVNELWE